MNVQLVAAACNYSAAQRIIINIQRSFSLLIFIIYNEHM